MPLGNGDISTNVWVEPSGDLCFYIGKTDTWGEFGQLYKVGKVRVQLSDTSGQPLLVVDPFRWELNLESGAINISTAKGWARLWVDANHPVIHVLAECPEKLHAKVQLEIWRKERRELTDKGERHSLHVNAPYPVYHEQDHNPNTGKNQILWHHHNLTSTWENNLKMQGLDALIETEVDPLLHRCFGGIIASDQLQKNLRTHLKPHLRSAC